MSDLLRTIFRFFEGLGYWGILLGMAVEVLPSELVLGYGGYLASDAADHRLEFMGAVIFGTIGGTIAQLILYWLGRYGGRPLLDRFGKYLLIKQKHLDKSEQWFQEYGPGVIFFARFVPVMRQVISIPAGIAKMPLITYTLFTVIATFLWAVLFVYIGMTLGDNWENIHETVQPLMLPLIGGAVLLTAAYIFAKVRKGKNNQ